MEPGSNWRHRALQARALPTELSKHAASCCDAAGRVGFEPTRLSPNAFRERRLQPLGHLPVMRDPLPRPDLRTAASLLCSGHVTASRSSAARCSNSCVYHADPRRSRSVALSELRCPVLPGPCAKWVTAPAGGVEPPTTALTGRRSTTELHRNDRGGSGASRTHSGIHPSLA